MKKDKLNKAAEDNAWGYTDRIEAEGAFTSGANWLMRQPLSERLTDAEKEKILKLYNKVQESNYDGTIEGVIKSSVSAVVMMCLVEIFGKDLFTNQPTAI